MGPLPPLWGTYGRPFPFLASTSPHTSPASHATSSESPFPLQHSTPSTFPWFKYTGRRANGLDLDIQASGIYKLCTEVPPPFFHGERPYGQLAFSLDDTSSMLLRIPLPSSYSAAPPHRSGIQDDQGHSDIGTHSIRRLKIQDALRRWEFGALHFLSKPLWT